MATQLTQNGVKFNDNSLQVSQAYPKMRNRIINGDMIIDQRTAGAVSIANTITNEYITVDRIASAATIAAKYTFQQNMNAVATPEGFTKYLGFKSSSAYALLATDIFIFGQTIEGMNIADLLWGTIDAKPITISFWARSSLAGTFSGTIKNVPSTYSYNFTYSLPDVDTWTRIEITIPGPTTGTWTKNNSSGLSLRFSMGVGTTNSTTNANVWQAGNFYGVTGTVSVVSTLNATFYITGLQLEEGEVATPFEEREYATELQRCQRYFQICYANTRGYVNTAAQSFNTAIHYYNEMRTVPTAILTAGTRANATATIPALDQYGATHRIAFTAAGVGYALVEKVTVLAEL